MNTESEFVRIARQLYEVKQLSIASAYFTSTTPHYTSLDRLQSLKETAISSHSTSSSPDDYHSPVIKDTVYWYGSILHKRKFKNSVGYGLQLCSVDDDQPLQNELVSTRLIADRRDYIVSATFSIVSITASR